MAMKYNANAETQKEFAPIPDAIYDIKVESCEEKTDRNDNPYFSAMLKIVGGDFDGRVVFANYIGSQSFGPCLVSCGVNVPDGQEIEAYQLVKRTGRVKTKWEEYNSKWSAKVALWIAPHRAPEPMEPLPAMPDAPDPGKMPESNEPPPDPTPERKYEQPADTPDALDDIPF